MLHFMYLNSNVDDLDNYTGDQLLQMSNTQRRDIGLFDRDDLIDNLN